MTIRDGAAYERMTPAAAAGGETGKATSPAEPQAGCGIPEAWASGARQKVRTGELPSAKGDVGGLSMRVEVMVCDSDMFCEMRGFISRAHSSAALPATETLAERGAEACEEEAALLRDVASSSPASASSPSRGLERPSVEPPIPTEEALVETLRFLFFPLDVPPIAHQPTHASKAIATVPTRISIRGGNCIPPSPPPEEEFASNLRSKSRIDVELVNSWTRRVGSNR
mmetsp:Transcript_168089/g.539815  ORF Transcript_168089/g.539815 Transcript_168089/m.539815 type:complete len:227 (+) Transcript_168089:203-883(+)